MSVSLLAAIFIRHRDLIILRVSLTYLQYKLYTSYSSTTLALTSETSKLPHACRIHKEL